MDKYVIVGLISGFISLFGYLPYIISIIRGNTQPNRATWLIWTVVGFLLALSYYITGDIKACWVPVAFFIGPLIVTILSFFYGHSQWSILDKICLATAGISIIVWSMTGNAVLALLINVLIDFIGAIPTLYKTYYHPESEDLMAWVLFFIGSAINVAAIMTWDITVIYPLYLVSITFTMVLLLLLLKTKENSVTN